MPAGGLSPGTTPEDVARRELLEEIGGSATELPHVGQFYTSNSISNEVAYVCFATGVELGETHQEPTELMEVHLMLKGRGTANGSPRRNQLAVGQTSRKLQDPGCPKNG